MRTFLTKYLPALIWAGLVAAALLMTGDSIEDVGSWFEIPDWLRAWLEELRPLAKLLWPWMDKLVHFGLFLVLAILVHRCFVVRKGDWGAPLKTLAATLLYIVILEAAQIRIPGRGWENLDIVAGIAGVLVAMVVSQLYLAWREE